MSAAAMVDLRCPGLGRLLARAAPSGTRAQGIVEVACWYCARAHRDAGVPCARVLHRYNLLGELLATEVVTG